jgi:FkbM family methyltransferase
MSSKAAIAYIIYNRPRHVLRTFEAIRAARPEQLFIIADGPKRDVVTDDENCRQALEIVRNIDWPCEVFEDVSPENLGLKTRVSSGLDWVFSHVDRVIVLEDDCLPHPDFFGFCKTLLERYASDENIWAITGDNFQKGLQRGTASYYFSKYPHCWGWATWKRCWEKYDPDISFWETFRTSGKWSSINAGDGEQSYWESIFDRVAKGLVNSWAYPWTACAWYHGGVTATPNVNLVTNIGFGPDGTHCLESVDRDESPRESLGEAIIHPRGTFRDVRADLFVFENHFKEPLRKSPPQLIPKQRSPAAMVNLLKKFISPRDSNLACEGDEAEKQVCLGDDDQRLLSIPRYLETKVLLEGKPFLIPDSVSCYYAYKEIFENEIYRFDAGNATPRIMDCGANIGLSVLYFKKLYPDASITAIEADPRIFTYLAKNLDAFGGPSVKILQKAVTAGEGEILFHHEGADAGCLLREGEESSGASRVASVKLDELITEPVDFLKMDIEGAEIDALLSCSRLGDVKRLFVEYHSFANRKQRLQELLQFFTEHGFRYYLSTVFSPEHPFLNQETQSGMDLQVNISCVRINEP